VVSNSQRSEELRLYKKKTDSGKGRKKTESGIFKPQIESLTEGFVFCYHDRGYLTEAVKAWSDCGNVAS
jgi:hypothetical protein